MDSKFPIGVDMTRVISTLAEQIYDTHLAFLRENVQNAIDAIRIQARRDAAASRRDDYMVVIEVDGTTVRISDNGIGMTLDEQRTFFWTMGASGKNNEGENARAPRLHRKLRDRRFRERGRLHRAEGDLAVGQRPGRALDQVRLRRPEDRHRQQTARGQVRRRPPFQRPRHRARGRAHRAAEGGRAQAVHPGLRQVRRRARHLQRAGHLAPEAQRPKRRHRHADAADQGHRRRRRSPRRETATANGRGWRKSAAAGTRTPSTPCTPNCSA